MNTITKAMLANKVDYINACLEGNSRLDIDYYNGACRVVKWVGTSAMHNISMLGTKRETYNFLRGMETSIDLVRLHGLSVKM